MMKHVLYILLLGVAHPSDLKVGGTVVWAPHTFTGHIESGSVGKGPSEPTWEENGSAGGYAFDDDADTAYINKQIHSCWTDASDISLVVIWTNTSGDALANTETVKLDFDYRSIDVSSETASNGVAAQATTTYTQSGAGVDGAFHETVLVLDWDSASQPITENDHIMGTFTRDVSGDTYSGSAIVTDWHLQYNANSVCHQEP